MKIVINKCYGGFSLSPRAVARLAELNGQKAYFFVGNFSQPKKLVPVEEVTGLFWGAYNTPNPSPNPSPAAWLEMPLKDRKASNARCSAETLSQRPDVRHDSKLVQVVEELGEAADGMCAELAVIEIPDGVEYEIEEYDGMESIHEKHRSWE